MIEIRTNMQFLSESLTAMISSSMDEILRRFNDRKGCPVNEYEDTEAAIEGFEKIDEQVDAAISDVITASQNVDEEGSPTTEPASELPVKRDSRPARILRSPFVVGEGKEPWHDGNVIVFGNYKDHVEETDKSAFLGWFQRGYKLKNRHYLDNSKKFNEHDDQIKPAFSIGLYLVVHKTWFHQLIDAETSLSGSLHNIKNLIQHHAHTVEQPTVAKFGKVKFRVTTTDSWFQNKIKDIFSAFQKDPQVLLSESSLIKAVTGRLISLSTSWADVDYVFMPLLPTNKAHWMLGLVEFRSHTLMLFNSAGKTYRDWKVLEGIEPYVKVLPAIMKVLGISKKDPDYNESECKQMKVTIDSTLPQQTNDHDCGVFVILYALYILRDDRCAILHQFDAAKCRIDITSLLYKHQESYVKKARQAFKGEGIVIE
ncbi:uncharacterized protein LOC111372944 [Olea europaea var. sylvestris]|uniref:uncharacterized protein LOC111372944 n=1 Tax=Olea europaea var. sylvestris TaxID=158386 RepID=UPI000C1CE4ED|nr:uncharacterized protein LOC111372944 [Olea europaea var. sylvestris]